MDFNEKDIRDMVESVLNNLGAVKSAGQGTVPAAQCGTCCCDPFPVEVSARHVHLTREAVDVLFGAGHQLGRKKMLSQPGEFLSEERVKLVTPKGQIDNVAVLGPERKAVQVELSATDAKSLGLKAPVNLSGDLSGAADVVIIGPNGILKADGTVIIAKAHLHLTPADAQHYGLHDGQIISVRIDSPRPITLNGVVARVRSDMALAMHIDFDEANAGMVGPGATGIIVSGVVNGDGSQRQQAAVFGHEEADHGRGRQAAEGGRGQRRMHHHPERDARDPRSQRRLQRQQDHRKHREIIRRRT